MNAPHKWYTKGVRLLRPNPKVWYGQGDPRRYAVLARLAVEKSLGRRDFDRARRIVSVVKATGRHLSTLPRSGTGWVTTMLTTAFDLEQGGSGDFDYRDDVLLSGHGAWVHPDIRLHYSAGGPAKLLHEVVTWKALPILDDSFFVSHYPLVSVIMKPTARGARTVVIVRHLVDQLSSWARHGDMVEEDAILATPRPQQAIEYCNFWGNYFADPPQGWAGLLVRYEDLIHNTSEQLRRICDFWSYDISSATLDAAVQMASRDAMEAKVAGIGSNKRISRQSERRGFSSDARKRLEAMICENLRHDFGYQYG